MKSTYSRVVRLLVLVRRVADDHGRIPEPVRRLIELLEHYLARTGRFRNLPIGGWRTAIFDSLNNISQAGVEPIGHIQGIAIWGLARPATCRL